MWLAKSIVILVSCFHFYILWIEMFAWETKGPKVFRKFPKEMFPKTKAMAANQGLYNGFLGTGLLWSLVIEDSTWSRNVAVYFLSCVFVAGLYGALSVSKRIFYVQGLPALVGLVACFLQV